MIESAHICCGNDNILQLSGVLNYKTVLSLYQKLEKFITSLTSIQVDLAQVEFSDSSGLALLVECWRCAKKQDKEICYVNMPKQMQAMAHVMGLSTIIPIKKIMESHG